MRSQLTPDGSALAAWTRRRFGNAATEATIASVMLAHGAALAQSAPASISKMNRTTLQQLAIPDTDQELRMDLLVLQPGVSVPLHHHPVAGLNDVIEGKVESAYGDHAACSAYPVPERR